MTHSDSEYTDSTSSPPMSRPSISAWLLSDMRQASAEYSFGTSLTLLSVRTRTSTRACSPGRRSRSSVGTRSRSRPALERADTPACSCVQLAQPASSRRAWKSTNCSQVASSTSRSGWMVALPFTTVRRSQKADLEKPGRMRAELPGWKPSGESSCSASTSSSVSCAPVSSNISTRVSSSTGQRVSSSMRSTSAQAAGSAISQRTAHSRSARAQ